MKDSESLQALLDSVAYPPTHTYELDGPVPTGQLADRVELMGRNFPEFFRPCRRFLDIGANKGYFSILFSKHHTNDVVAIDNRKEFTDLGKQLNPCVDWQHTSFRNFTPEEPFDRIFIGNVGHYMFVDSGGSFDWWAKLAAMSTGLVLFEGPISNDCPDIPYVMKEHPGYLERFTVANFSHAYQPWFEQAGFCTSIPESPGRFLILFKRKPTAGDHKYSFKQFIPHEDIHKTTTSRISKSELWGENCIVKTYPPFRNQHEMAMQVANHSPHTSSCIGKVTRGNGSFAGWIEPELTPITPLADHWTILWKSHCAHQLWLIRQGYIDTDIAVFNFGWAPDRPVPITLDKNGIIPLQEVEEGHANLYFHAMQTNFFNRLAASESIKMLKEAWKYQIRDGYGIEQAYIDLSIITEADL